MGPKNNHKINPRKGRNNNTRIQITLVPVLARLCKDLERHCRAGGTHDAGDLARAIGVEFEHVREELAERSRATAS